MRRRVALAVTVALAASAAPAQAGTAERGDFDCERVSFVRQSCSVTVGYRGGPGEANIVTVAPATVDGQPAVRFADSGATVVAGRDCAATGDHDVVCRLPYADTQTVEVVAGDGDDRVDVADPANVLRFVLRIDGGPGADTLVGGPGDETFVGGPGTDSIAAGDGADEMLDGGPAGEPDSFAGGRGRDRVSFHGRPTAVRADLRTSNDGDALDGVEGLTGGSGDDTLRGDGEGNSLGGGRGDDDIRAGGGADVVNGGGGDDRLGGDAGKDRIQGARGRDQIDGGPDNDRINPDDGSLPDDRVPDTLACGTGFDVVEEGTVEDYAAPGCERVGMSDLLASIDPNTPLPSLRSVVATLRDAVCTDRRRCTTTLEVLAAPGERRVRAGTVLGRSEQRRTVRLSPIGRALLTRHRALRVRVTMEHRSPELRESGGFTTDLRVG